MSFERWGSLSVADHTDTAALVADVLLYDRLVFPVMAPAIDRNEEAYWKARGWDPKLQAQRIGELQELAIRRPWSEARRQFFKNRKAELLAERHDAQFIDSYQMTRMILAQEQVTEKLPGVQHVDVIAAYNSLDGVRNDFQLSSEPDAGEQARTQALLLTRRLAIPDLPNPEESLKLAIELSRNEEFRARRADLFDWQERMAAKGLTAEEAVEALSEMSDKYNAVVLAARAKVRWKLAFTIATAGLALAGGFTAIAGASAALGLVKFAMFDGTPAIDAGSAKPAAMFHDIEATIGARLRPAG
jgi:hypothetical protein